MSIVLNGQKIATPGLETVSWLDDPHVPMTTDGYTRQQWIRMIVLHTVHGKVGGLKPGIKPSTRAEAYAVYQAHTSRDVSWDYTIDTDGTIVVSNDPIKHACWHAEEVNPISLGIEMIQDDNGDLYEGQMEAVVKFLDFITRELADRGHPIQRQVPVTKDGKPVEGVVPRVADRVQCKSVVGIVGHRNQTSNRGPGDPGNHIFKYLLEAGYKGFNYDLNEDLTFWKAQQQRLGTTAVDGIAGCEVQAKLILEGHRHGLLVSRPGD